MPLNFIDIPLFKYMRVALDYQEKISIRKQRIRIEKYIVDIFI